MNSTDLVRDQIIKQVIFFRATLLDGLELHSDPKSWPLIRKQVFRALGDSGLQGAIERVLSHYEGMFYENNSK